jgi:hypothetical protein
VDIWTTIATEAERESPLWADALLPGHERQLVAVFSTLLDDDRHALAVETIYEGYLLHYGRPRLFAAGDGHSALLLGDYLYAHGLVRVAAHDDVDAVADLAALISLCAQLRADEAPGDGEAWALTAAQLGRRPLRDGFEPGAVAELARETATADTLGRALSLHADRVG